MNPPAERVAGPFPCARCGLVTPWIELPYVLGEVIAISCPSCGAFTPKVLAIVPTARPIARTPVTTANPCQRPFCKGSLWPDEYGDRHCSLCGRSPAPISVLPLVKCDLVFGPMKRGRPPKTLAVPLDLDARIIEVRTASVAAKLR